MIEIRRILCPIDFSDFSRHALGHAVALAKWYDATITALHVRPAVPVDVKAFGGLPPASLAPAGAADALAALRRFAGEEVGTAVPLRLETIEGDAAGTILSAAETMAADLIVMGTHGRSGFDRLLFGSVAEKVLRKAECPVLTVPRRVPDAVPVSTALFRRVLCAIDFSECSLHALEYAMSVAQEAGGGLTVLHVIELPERMPHGSMPGTGWTVEAYVSAIEVERRQSLSTVVPSEVHAYCAVETVLATGKPYQQILRTAAEQQSDLIVIGIHGRGAADLLFFGSTTQRVVRDALCPVLTLRTA